MRLEMSRTAAAAGLTAAMTARTFYGLALDAPEAMNAAWLAAPLGAVLALPAVWLIIAGRGSRLLNAALLAGTALDAAAAIEWTAFSESCLAFDHTSPVLLMLPLLLAVARCAWLGGDAVGGAARIWARVFLLLLAIPALCQLLSYKTCWLAPWLGPGAGGVLHAALRAAGWNVLLCGAAVGACAERMCFRDLLPCILLSACVAALLLALHRMMVPTAVGETITRQIRIDALLTNGRAPLVLQLPRIVAWFAGMLHLMAFDAVAACCLIHRLRTGMGEGVSAALGLGAIFALAMFRVPNLPLVRTVSLYSYHVIALAALVKGVRQRCAASG